MWIFWVIPLANGLWIGLEGSYPIVSHYFLTALRHIVV